MNLLVGLKLGDPGNELQALYIVLTKTKILTCC